MKAFEEWGFGKLLGASVLVPHSNEFIGVDITSLTKQEGIYLSYPSLWLIFPYVVFKVLGLLPLNLDLSAQYLQIYALIVNRLACGIAIYYLYLEIIKIIAKGITSEYRQRAIAFLGLLGWIFTPIVMQNTQNLYFSDQAVLLPIYIIFLIALRCRFKLEELSISAKWLLFLTSFIASGMDWYGWVSIAIVMAIALVDQCLLISKSSFSLTVFVKQYWNSIKWLAGGTIISGIIFLAQLFYYDDGFNQLFEIFFTRTSGDIGDGSGSVLSLTSILLGILNHWITYYPPLIQNIVKHGDYFHVTIIIITSILIFSVLLYLYIKSEDKKLNIYSYVLLFFTPLIQLYLLKNHSFIHQFSALKMSVPISFSLLILPALLLCLIWEARSKTFRINSFKANVFVSILIFTVGLTMIFSSQDRIIELAGEPEQYIHDLKALIANNVAPEELPIVSIPVASEKDFATTKILWIPPERLWQVKRFVYTSHQLQYLLAQKRTNIQKNSNLKLVYLAYEDEPLDNNVRSLCQREWSYLAEKINDRSVIACRSSRLNKLFK